MVAAAKHRPAYMSSVGFLRVVWGQQVVVEGAHFVVTRRAFPKLGCNNGTTIIQIDSKNYNNKVVPKCTFG